MDNYQFDDSFRQGATELIAGIDEAGRGPIAGPVVASAVVLDPVTRFRGLTDSKVVSEKNRERLFFEILVQARGVGVGVCEVDEIAKHNILGATKLAMKKAVAQLPAEPHLLLLDAIELPGVSIQQSPHVKGDLKSACIAAASIVAKYMRDRIMLHYHGVYPVYGFDRHKGYGTKKHMELVRLHGPSPQHRAGFRGVRELTLPF